MNGTSDLARSHATLGPTQARAGEAHWASIEQKQMRQCLEGKDKAAPRVLGTTPAAAAEEEKVAAAGIICRAEEEGERKRGFWGVRERKVLQREEGVLPRVQIMGPEEEGLMRNSFCITSEHFKEALCPPSLLFLRRRKKKV